MDSTLVQVLGPLAFSDPCNAFAEAFVKAQSSMDAIGKDKTAKITGDKGSYSYKFADLAAVLEAVTPALNANGIAIIQAPQIESGGAVTIETRLLHASGQWARSLLTMKPTQTTPQGLGSTITFARRYSAQAMCGVAPEDDDGSAGSARNGHDVEPAPARDPAPPADPQAPSPWKIAFGELEKAVKYAKLCEWSTDQIAAVKSELIGDKASKDMSIEELTSLANEIQKRVAKSRTAWASVADGEVPADKGAIDLVARMREERLVKLWEQIRAAGLHDAEDEVGLAELASSHRVSTVDELTLEEIGIAELEVESFKKRQVETVVPAAGKDMSELEALA